MKTVIDESVRKPWLDDGYIGDFAVREMVTRYGAPHDGHAHWIDHITVFVGGPARVLMRLYEDPLDSSSPLVDECEIDVLTTPWVLNIKADWWHQVIALDPQRPSVRFCIFSVAQGDAAGIPRNDFNFERLTHG